MSNAPQKPFLYLITGNSRIGGAQRILIDEFYEFSERKVLTKIVSLSPSFENDEILNVDNNFAPSKNVRIYFAGNSKLKQLQFFMREFKNNQFKVHVISHDFTGALIARCAGVLTFKRIVVDLYVHQLLDLSDSIQRQKRIFLSLFASNIFVSSYQFKQSWEDYLQKSKFWKYVFRRSIEFDRMGIFIPRALNSDFSKNQVCKSSVPHIIFMSRITAWKGFKVFFDYAKAHVNNSMHSLILTTKNGRPEIFHESSFVDELNHVIYESGVANLAFPLGSVHLYPTNYGAGVSYPQSIGMNVLELLAVGIPSVISPEGFQSWPELEHSPMITTSSWSEEANLESTVTKLSNLSKEEIENEVERISSIISISSHVDRILTRILK